MDRIHIQVMIRYLNVLMMDEMRSILKVKIGGSGADDGLDDEMSILNQYSKYGNRSTLLARIRIS